MMNYLYSSSIDSEEVEDPSLDEMSIDVSLGTVERLNKYVQSTLFLHRLYVVKDISESIRTVEYDTVVSDILPVLMQLAADAEPLIREPLMQELPKMAEHLMSSNGPDCYTHVRDTIFPILYKHLLDDVEKVRSVALQSLIPILRIIKPEDRESCLCAQLPELTKRHSRVEHRVTAMLIMSTSAEVLGRELVEKYAVPIIQTLSTDPMFLVRKSCAEGIGAVARIVSQETTCTVLLQVFDELSEQEPWGVRKSCVDSFLDVARNVTPEIRENQLCDAIQRLAEDSSRWVRAEAWRVLGPFIYTFTSTNKSLAASASTEEIADTESTADKTASLESIEEQATLDVAALERKMEDISVSESTETPSLADKDKLGFSGSPPTSPKVRPPEITVTAHGSDGSGGESDASAGETTDEGGVTIEVSDISEANATEEEDESSDNAFQPQAQIHVPERIINLYKSMASVQNKKAATTLDGDMVFHCAYNFPAVLLALGPGMWPSFAPMYNTLVDDLQWNVRSTLAHSIHEIAKIIGREKAETDLVPTFSKFLNDMDEVKTGVVKHFVEFISCLSETKRLSYLYQLDEIVLTSNKHNWRYKVLFIEQLANMCDIFTPEELMDDDGAFAHLVLRLAEDDIYSVREAAYDSLGKLFNKLYMTGKDELYADVSNAILHDFLQSKSSIYRQNYVHLCYHLASVCDAEVFREVFLTKLTNLATDKVPNVRISLAVLIPELAHSEIYGKDPSVLEIIDILKKDSDKDVQACISTYVAV